jgi:drug/metabolite transporter (DMT)-like permease
MRAVRWRAIVRYTWRVIALLGLGSALIYGASDFFAGLASRRLSSLFVAFSSSVVASLLVLAGVLVSAPVWSVETIALGALAGLLGSIGTWAFYASLAIGPMSVISPGVATIYAVVPAIAGIAFGERFPPIGYVALVAVLAAAVLLSLQRGRSSARVRPRAVVLGAVAGLGYAGYIIAIDRTTAESGLAPLLTDFGVAIVVLGLALLLIRARSRTAEEPPQAMSADSRSRGLLLCVVTGVTLAAGNILLVIGLHTGDLAVMGVLNSLYPLGTVLLAVIVLRERLSILQSAGVVLALAGSALLAVD